MAQKQFVIDGYGARVPCKRDDFQAQKLVETQALLHNYKDLIWSEEGRKFICACVEFDKLEQARAYLTSIGTSLFPKNRNWNLEEQLYVRVDRGYITSLYSEPERRIKFGLQAIIGGATEVKTPLGRIDLLTDTELIEVKPFSSWKAAIGQVLVYGSFYPQHNKHIHLFDRLEQKTLHLIQEACTPHGIQVTFEIDKGWQ